MPNTPTLPARRRSTQAALDRTLRVAERHGRVAVGAKHYPNGVVEFTFAGSDTAASTSNNPWDE